MKKYDVLLMGEALVDFVPEEDRIPGPYRALVGGAPNNVACGLGKLGMEVALLARVGRDALGKSVIQMMKECGVDTQYIQVDDKRFTTVTIVMPKSEDMMRYAIYRKDSADGALTYEEIPSEIFKHAKILHYGSLGMAEEISAKTMLQSIAKAKENGMKTSVDINLRPGSWKSVKEMIEKSHYLIEVSDIVKMTKEEAQVLRIDPKKLAKEQSKIVIVTNGGDMASIYMEDLEVSQKPKKIETVDVTGGGDSFMSAFLYFYISYWNVKKQEQFLREAIDFAICASSISVQRYGAIDSLPTLKEIEEARK